MASAASGQDLIRMNQVGLFPGQEMTAVVEGQAKGLSVTDAKTDRRTGRAKVVARTRSPWSGKQRSVVSITGLTAPGDYVLRANGEQMPFRVKEHALSDLAKASLKAFYYQRTAVPIEERYAGKWSRPAGHMDDKVMIHPSAVSPGRPAGTIISSPLGWYDAGDYNKYIVNSAFSIGLMLCSYEQARAYYDSMNANIPESRNQTADVLDEIMLTMQDPWDGGVYHKLTTPNFEDFVMPSECHQQRYVVQKSVTATYDFAAVMAQAARIYKGNADYPGFSEQAARAAMAAYRWAEEHSEALYFQEAMSRQFKPAVTTGTYGDFSARDERFWAATELYLLTGDKLFLGDASCNEPATFTLPTWGNLASLGSYEWLTHRTAADEMAKTARRQLLAWADSIVATTPHSAFRTPTGNKPGDFFWGCLSETFCGAGMALLYAYGQTQNSNYLTAAQQCADYVLGRNATGYCYVTGFGQKSPRHPHHRLSAADGIDDPIPGLLVGGPNPGQQDVSGGLTYPSKQPDESYLDEEPSYASNEIAINWNASLLSLMAWLDAVSR